MLPLHPSDKDRLEAAGTPESGMQPELAAVAPQAERSALTASMSHVHPSGNLFSPEGTASPALTSFLEKIGISTDGTRTGILQALIPLHTSSSIVTAISDRYGSSDALPFIGDLTALSFIEKVDSPPRNYQDALLYGGPVDWVRERIAHLLQQWEQGVRFERLVMLGSDRPRDEGRWRESVKRICAPDDSVLPLRPDWSFRGQAPTDEYDIMRIVFDQAKLPDEWGTSVPVVWLRTTREMAGGRVDTAATVRHYLNELPGEKRAVLAASSQPFVQYQLLATADVFRREGTACEMFQGIGASSQGYSAPITGYLKLLIRRIALEQKLDHPPAVVP